MHIYIYTHTHTYIYIYNIYSNGRSLVGVQVRNLAWEFLCIRASVSGARCAKPVFARLCPTVAKRGDPITLNRSGSAAMTVPWSVGSVPPKTETKHPRLHHHIYLTLITLRQSFAVNDIDGMAMCKQEWPRKTWFECVKTDVSNWGLFDVGPQGMESRCST